MAWIKNPYGRLVDVSDEKPIDEKTGLPSKKVFSEFQNWQMQPGYSLPTQDEVDEHIKKRTAQVSEWKEGERRNKEIYINDGVYFVTVSQGGKDGYGIASGHIYEGLKDLGVNISFGNDGQRVALLFHAPYSLSRLESPIRVLYTMFESDKIPDDWHDYLESADMILVPSKWCQEVFAKAGFKTTVVPLGYDNKIYKPIIRHNKRENHENFTFLHYNAFNIRKGFPEVFKAFVQAFRPDEPVRMIFKTTLDHPPLAINPTQYPNIEIITGSLGDDEMHSIMERSDAFVFPSRGEGFGITPLEAMATGLPTIVPNAHGITEYFNSDFMYEVKVKEKCPALYSRYKGQDVGNMVICDVDDLARQMRYIYEHEDDARAKGMAASGYVSQWTFARTSQFLKAIIDDLLKKPETEQPIKNMLRMDRLR